MLEGISDGGIGVIVAFVFGVAALVVSIAIIGSVNELREQVSSEEDEK